MDIVSIYTDYDNCTCSEAYVLILNYVAGIRIIESLDNQGWIAEEVNPSTGGMTNSYSLLKSKLKYEPPPQK
jgi:hypothetical protein